MKHNDQRPSLPWRRLRPRPTPGGLCRETEGRREWLGCQAGESGPTHHDREMDQVWSFHHLPRFYRLHPHTVVLSGLVMKKWLSEALHVGQTALALCLLLAPESLGLDGSSLVH